MSAGGRTLALLLEAVAPATTAELVLAVVLVGAGPWYVLLSVLRAVAA